MAKRDIIVVGASAGGVEALTGMVGQLPPGLPAALFVVCHFPANVSSRLPEILSRSGPILAVHARDGDRLRPGQIYVAPPDHHLVLEADAMRVTPGPRENRHRPAIDVLFRSAARVHGRRVIAVLLSGSLGDGVAGLLAVRTAGGTAIIQDPQDALVADLPTRARDIAGADYYLPVGSIGRMLIDLVRSPAEPQGEKPMADPLEELPQTVERDMAAQTHNGRRGALSILSCPECGGVLWQVDQKEPVRFRCHVGHAYYGEGLLDEQAAMLEAALWTAVRIFKEKTILSRQLAEREQQLGNLQVAQSYEEYAAVSERYGNLIQEYLAQNSVGPPDAAAGSKTPPAETPAAEKP